MKKPSALLQRTFVVFTVLWFLSLAVVWYVGWGIRNPDGTDGWGRGTYPTPWIFRPVAWRSTWPGFWWFAAEWGIFWGSVGATVGLTKVIFRKE